MEDLNRKIFYALEKFFSAYRSMLWEINNKYSISPIMVQFLKYISEHNERDSTVTNLSLEYSLTKPTVSDAINTLIKKGFLKSRKSKEDSRVKYLYLTPKGERTIKDINRFESWFYDALKLFPKKQKSIVYTFLVEILRILKKNGSMDILRSCVLCENFEANKYINEENPHFCSLLNLRLNNDQIKIDCPSNKPSELLLREKGHILIMKSDG
ncbi:MAG: MarR family winged helix-turn-helix transcriptional regulator [Myxococcota bacterium]